MKKIKIHILNFLLRHLFNALTEADVLVVSGKSVIIQGEVVSPEIRTEIISGARMLQQLAFWKLLRREMQIEANRRIYLKSLTQDDLIFGKAVLWTIDLMEKKIDNLSRM